MRQLLIGDCHFGISSNSITWLENQLKFFNTQIVDILDNKNIDRVTFLGDLFDIRYYTPTREVPLCGHATLASAHILYELGVVDKKDIIITVILYLIMAVIIIWNLI